MKRPSAAGKKNVSATKCKEVSDWLLACDVADSAKEMLAGCVPCTLGQLKASRHPFNERVVQMISEVLQQHKASLEKTLAEKETKVAELTPAKATREAALDEAKQVAKDKEEALATSKQAANDNAVLVKEATANLKTKIEEQTTGDSSLAELEKKKSMLTTVQQDALTPLLEGSPEPADKTTMIQNIVKTANTFDFDASLMEASVKVLEKDPDARGAGFDETCMEQIKESFKNAIAKIDQQLDEGAPAKAARAAAVEESTNAKAAAEQKQEELVAEGKAAKEAKDEATAAVKEAANHLTDFIPELKAASDELDEAKAELVEFIDGPLASYNILAELTEDTFKEPEVKKSYYETIDGQKCDRAIIDACRTAVAGQGDGRVSLDDAKNVFLDIADGNKETRVERWTVRYCMEAFKWTEAAHDWVIEACKKVKQEDEEPAAKKAKTEADSYYEVIDGWKCKRDIVNTCRELITGQGDGRISHDDAEKVWAKAADGPGVTDIEKWTLRYCLSEFNWTRSGHDFLLEKLMTLQA